MPCILSGCLHTKINNKPLAHIMKEVNFKVSLPAWKTPHSSSPCNAICHRFPFSLT